MTQPASTPSDRPGLLMTAGPTPRRSADAPAAFAHLDRIGCRALWMTDHLFWGRPMPEAMALCAVAAATTERCTIGTGVLQLPLRSPATIAKAASTVQDLSGGRFVLGVGVGEHRAEYQRADADFGSRGRELDRQIAAVRELWRPAAEGDWFAQRPAPDPPPIWIGGRSVAAIDRAAGNDGWMPLFLTADDFAAANVRLDEAVLRAGRPAASVTRAVTAIAAIANDRRAIERARTWCGDLWNIPPDKVAKYLLVGSADRVVDGLAGYRAAGADHVAVLLATDDPVPMFERLLEAGGWGAADR